MKLFKKLFFISISLIAIYILFIVFSFFISPKVSDYLNRTEFDSKEWIEWTDTEVTQRLRWNMIHDLTTNYQLKNLNLKELKKLLGEPDNESTNSLSYHLGLSSSWGINEAFLVFELKNNIVVNYEIWEG